MEDGKKVAIGAGIVTATGLGIWGLTKLFKKKPIIPVIYECPYCGGKFSSEAELQAHLAEYHPEEPPAIFYTCPYCDVKFATEKELKDHIKAEHPEELLVPDKVIELPYYFTVLGIDGIPFSKVKIETISPKERLTQWEFTDSMRKVMSGLIGAWGWTSERVLAAAHCATARIGDPYTVTYAELKTALEDCGVNIPGYSHATAYWWVELRYYWWGVFIPGDREWAFYQYPTASQKVITAYLAEPIVMDALRGITATCLYRHDAQPGAVPTGTAYLRFRPTFETEMGPTAAPAFRGFWGFTDAQDGKVVSIAIHQLFGAGYCYPGMYDAEIDLGGAGDSKFVVKNLARVTEEETVIS